MTTFNFDDVKAYFTRHKVEAPLEALTRLTELSQGRPIFIALSLDWMRSGNMLEVLIECTADEFERKMVERVQQLYFSEDQAILAMAYFHRRFNAEIMAYIFDQPENIAEQSLEATQDFSFVKYRPPVDGGQGSCVLHDEMRNLIHKHVWPSLDDAFEYRQGWARKIIQYYKDKIEQERSNLKKRNLQLERIYYWLDADFKAGLTYSQVLFYRAWEDGDVSGMDAIDRETQQEKHKKTDLIQRIQKFRRGAFLFVDEKFDEAIEILTELLDDLDCETFLRGSAQSYLVQAYLYRGNPRKAIQDGQTWEVWFEEVLQDDEIEAMLRSQLEKDFGWLCNVIGLAYRYQNNLSKTEQYYNKALLHYETADKAYARIAATKNNLGFIYHKLGRDGEALSHCKMALRIREKLDSPDRGYSYNVIGMIHMDQMRPNEAVDYFQRAQKVFQEKKMDWGNALVGVSYGRLMRQWGRYKEQYGGEDFNPSREEYLQATAMFEDSINVFRKQHDHSNLSEALNEYGTLLRQQEKWKQAIVCFSESATLSEKIDNQYRYVDNLTDFAILYDYAGEQDKALDYAKKAGRLIIEEKINAFGLLAKSQQIVTNVLFERSDYDAAFEAAADACVYIMRLDPQKLGESPAKRETYYSNMVDWLEEKILRLPTHNLAQDKTQVLIERWQKEETDGYRLADSDMGFITRMRDLAKNYPFLKVEG